MKKVPKIHRLKATDATTMAPKLTAIALRAKRSWGYPERWIEEWTPQLTFDAGSLMACWTWVAYDGPRPAGFTILDGVDPQTGLWTQPAGTNDRQIGSGPEEKVVALEHLWIDPSDHGLGLGRSLFEVLHRQAEQTGADWLEVYSDPNADGFYRRMGFEPHSEFRSTVCGEDRCLPIVRMRLG